MFQIHERTTIAILTAAVWAAATCLSLPATAQEKGVVAESDGPSTFQYVLCLDAIRGSGVGPEFPGCVEILSLGLEVGRPIVESGEKSGTETISLGTGELSPVTIEKPADGISPMLFGFAVNGSSMGRAEIFVLEHREGWLEPRTIQEVRLDNTFVQSLRVDPESRNEIIELPFSKIQLTSFEQKAKTTLVSEYCWDTVRNTTGCKL